MAANGPVSLRSHTDALSILADQSVTITSVNGEIRIAANEQTELVAGQSSISLKGADIEFTTPGVFTAHGATHAFEGAGSGVAGLPDFPAPLTTIKQGTMHLDHRHHDDEGLNGASYELLLPDGSKKTGTLDSRDKATVEGVHAATAEVRFGPSAGALSRVDKGPTPAHDANTTEALLKRLVEKYYRSPPDSWRSGR